MSSSRQRRDGDRRPSDRSNDRRDREDRRDAQPDDEQQRRPNDPDMQESDSLIALKAILGKVAGLLTSLKLTQDESISLVEQLYGSVLDMDVKLAGETDDKRKASVQAHIQKTNITRSGGKLVVDFPKIDAPKAATKSENTKPAEAPDTPQQKPVPEAKPAPKPAPAPEQASAPETPEAATEDPGTSTAEAATPAPEAESAPEQSQA